MAQRIGVISQGKLIAEGTLDDLRGQAGSVRGGTSLEEVFLTLVGSTQRRHDDKQE
jgi:ABC-2 type transport system ATP-binding protein